MAQTNFTPISLYYSTTAAAVPTAGNLVPGELAINTADGKLFYKDSAGVVQTIASKDTNSGTFTNISVSGVASFADGTVSLPSITNIGDTNTGIFFPAADTIAFTEGGVEAMRINSSAYVGIGTTTPATKLVVKGTHVGGEGLINIIADSGTQFAALSFTNNVTQKGIVFHDNTNNLFYLYGAAGQGLAFNSNDAERMRITSAGDVGIGTSSPAYKLDIQTSGNGVAVRASSGNAYLRLEPVFGTGASYIDFVASGSSAQDARIIGGSGSTSNLAFLTGGASLTERMRITSAGNVLIGKTADNDTTLGVRITGGIVNSAGTNDFWNSYSTSAGVYRFYVTNGGTVTATSTTISAISDQRLKENIRDLDTGLDEIMAVKPRRFDWKEGKGLDKRDDIGFIAQEFETVFPNSVNTSKAGADGIEYKTVNHSELIPTLVKAIQELKAEFDAYKATHP